MKAFLSHSSRDSEFVCQVASILKRHIDVFYYEEHQKATEGFPTTIKKEMKKCDVFVFFVGKSYEQSIGMQGETNDVLSLRGRRVINVGLDGFRDPQAFPKSFPDKLRERPFVEAVDPVGCTREIIQYLNKGTEERILWRGSDGLPYNAHLFSYEKDIIDFFACREHLGAALFDPPKNPEHATAYEFIRDMLYDGCPVSWPQAVDLHSTGCDRRRNHLPEEYLGAFRERAAKVAATALSGHHTNELHFEFCEGGPREELVFPSGNGVLNVGVLVSGGIAPGINAVINGIVKRHWLYATGAHQVNVVGYLNGFHAFDGGRANRSVTLTPDRTIKGKANHLVTADYANQGGSMLGTSRLKLLSDPNKRPSEIRRILNRLQGDGIHILYLIGGDGTMKAAHALWNVAQEQVRDGMGMGKPLSVVAVPKTMDNDILWMWQSFGFLSAVEKAREVVDHLHTEIKSNPRVCVVQLFGSDSGFVVSHAVLASAAGQCDLALIPEVPFSLLGIAQYLKRRIHTNEYEIPRALIILAETAIPVDSMWYLDESKPLPNDMDEGIKRVIAAARAKLREQPILMTPEEMDALHTFEADRIAGKRLQGQTSDALRSAGLKLVTQGLDRLLKILPDVMDGRSPPDWSELRVMANEPRHLLRAIPPSTSDIIMGQRLGILAVDNAMAGFTDFMIGQWLTEFVLVPLGLVVLGRKRIPESGIFWKSVLAKTEQPPDLVAPWPKQPKPSSTVNLSRFLKDLRSRTA